MKKGKVCWLRLSQLNVPMPALRSWRRRLGVLSASIDGVGVLVPLVVRRIGEDEYSVIAGVGRLEGLQMTGAGPKTLVPCIVVEVDDAEATLLALVENVVREEMRPFDEAEAVRVLVEDYGYTQARVAAALGTTQSSVSEKLAVFRLHKKVVAALRAGKIDVRPALALMPLVDDRRGQLAILKRMLEQKMSAAEVSALVAKHRFGAAAIEPLSFGVAGAGRVKARTTAMGKVRVVLEANDRDALDKLWTSLRKRMS